MTGLAQQDDTRCADGPLLVTVCALPGQRLPLCITALRPLAVVACEALPHADALLARDGARLAVKLPARGSLAHTAPLPE